MSILQHGRTEGNANRNAARHSRHAATAEVDAEPYYDRDAITEALRVDVVLERFGICVDAGNSNTACPLHNGDGEKSFSIYNEGRNWRCHSQCDESGDVIWLIVKLAAARGKRITRSRAEEIAAQWAEVDPSAPPAPEELAARRAEHERKKAEEAAQRAHRRDEAARRAKEEWYESVEAWFQRRRGDKRHEICRRYLASRGISRVLDGSTMWTVAATRFGEPLVPIYGFAIDMKETSINPIVSLAWRRITPDASPKVLVTKGSTIEGTFGQSYRLTSGDYEAVAIVEGVTDFLTGVLIWRNKPVLVLGGHSVNALTKIIPALADHSDARMAAKFRAMQLRFVTHQDENGAGANAEAKMIEQAEERGIRWVRLDLDSSKDLNDWAVARLKSARQP